MVQLTISEAFFIAGFDVARRDTLKDFILSLRAHLARIALAARFVREEAAQSQQHIAQIALVVEDHHRAGAERQAARPQIFKGQFHIEISSGVAKPPAAPPINIACKWPPVTPPAKSSMRCRSVTPKGTSYTPGRATSPDTQNNFGPVDFSVPKRANASAPCAKMYGIFASVSTLLMTVGLPNKPYVAGKGGFMRGKPRLPSIDSNSAVSSPQMYAPAPDRTSTSSA